MALRQSTGLTVRRGGFDGIIRTDSFCTTIAAWSDASVEVKMVFARTGVPGTKCNARAEQRMLEGAVLIECFASLCSVNSIILNECLHPWALVSVLTSEAQNEMGSFVKKVMETV